MKKDYEHEALLYAERYGIIDYTVKGSVMKWKEKHWMEGTYEYTEDLASNKSTSKLIKKWGE